MAPAESQKHPPKKWTRTRAPKVRTGCITCKRRHLKCDETKPECQRCLKDKWRCDGYHGIQSPRTEPNPETGEKMDKPRIVAPGPLRPTLFLTNQLSRADAILFHHAREYCIKYLDVDTCSGFWNKFVLPLAQTVEAVGYALCALGGAHHRYAAGSLGNSSIVSSVTKASIENYNRAIVCIRSLMIEDTKFSIEIVLICCIIFISIENLHGRYNDSKRHLQAGCRLLNSLQGNFGLKGSHLIYDYRKDISNAKQTFLEAAANILRGLGRSVAIYEGSDIFTGLDLPSYVIDMGDSSLPFADLSEAYTLLGQVHETYDRVALNPWSIATLWCDDPASRRVALAAARSTFATWNSRYELMRQDKRYANPLCVEKRLISSLDMHQATWSAIAKMTIIDDVFDKEDCELIIQRASFLLEMEAKEKYPVFAFSGHIIPPLSLVCSSCGDIDVQRKCIALLRTVHRREGIWDSQEVADIYETMITARLRRVADWNILPWGIPQLAAELSLLSLSGSKTSIHS